MSDYSWKRANGLGPPCSRCEDRDQLPSRNAGEKEEMHRKSKKSMMMPARLRFFVRTSSF